MPKRALFTVAVVVLAVAVLSGFTLRGPLQREFGRRGGQPNVAWVTAEPAAEGLDSTRVAALWTDLAARRTSGFAIARGGHLVYENYGGDRDANTRFGASAASKALAATVIVLAGVTDGLVQLDDSLCAHLPDLRADPLRSKIRLRHLINHTSGIEDVDFVKGELRQLEGWKQHYYDHRSDRFHYSFSVAPVRFEPGSRMEYSGVGFYALAYVFGRALNETPYHDIKRYYGERVMLPLGIPNEAWDLNYRDSDSVDGMTMYAFGSGASFTARTAIRLGQVMLDGGTWGGHKIFDARHLEDLFSYEDPSTYHGWLLNKNGAWPSLPRDAALGVGGSHNTVLIVPSLDLVVARFGGSLGDNGERTYDVLDPRLFAPLMNAVIGPSSRGNRALSAG
jgi:CubicO group peptidase (beta-lactamase class C family)